MKNPKPKSITRRTREPPIAVRDPSAQTPPTRRRRVSRSTRASRDHPIVQRGFDTPARKSVASVQSTGGSARAPVVGRRPRSERCGISIHPSIGASVRVFGVSHPKRRIVIRRIETWVIRFRPLARYRRIDRSDEPTSRAVRRDERDGRTRRNEVKQNSPILCVPVATRVSRRRPIDASHLASRIHDPLLASRTRASRSNLKQQQKKINSVPFRSHP